MDMEVFLIRSLVLKDSEKSIRRLHLAKKTNRICRIDYPEGNKDVILQLPETCVMGMLTRSSPLFIHRFSMLEPADTMLHPAVAQRIQYRLELLSESAKSFRLERSAHVEGFEVPSSSRILNFESSDPPCSLLRRDWVINCDSGNLFEYRTGDLRIWLAEIGPKIVHVISKHPDMVFRSSLLQMLEEFKNLVNREKVGRIFLTIADCLRYFLIQTNFETKSLCAQTWRSPNNEELCRQIQDARIQILEVLVEFWEGPLQILCSVDSNKEHRSFAIREMNQVFNVLKKDACKFNDGLAQSADVLFWKLCTLEFTTLEYWIRFIDILSETQYADFIEQVSHFAANHLRFTSKRNSTVVDKTLVEATMVIQRWIDWAEPQFYNPHGSIVDSPKWSVSCLKASEKKLGACPNPALRLIPSIISRATPFMSPQKLGKSPTIEIAYRNFLFRMTTQASRLEFVITTASDTTRMSIGAHFLSTSVGTWEYRSAYLWPTIEVADLEAPVASTWKCLAAEATVTRVFLLCTDEKTVLLTALNPFSAEDHKDAISRELKCGSMEQSDFVTRLCSFYQDYHDPHRSDAFVWVEADSCILWAVLLPQKLSLHSELVLVILLLTKVKVSKDQIHQTSNQKFCEEHQLNPMVPVCAGKHHLDPRYNSNLYLQFWWRQIAGRTIGLWLRAETSYAIFILKHDLFHFCGIKKLSNTKEFWMAELIARVPSSLRDEPIYLRKSNTLQLDKHRCSFVIIELDLKFN